MPDGSGTAPDAMRVPADIAISDAPRMKPKIAEAILRSGKSLADLPVPSETYLQPHLWPPIGGYGD